MGDPIVIHDPTAVAASKGQGAPEVECRRCDGFGKHAMPPAYAAVFTLLDSEEWRTTTAIGKQLPKVGQTALANRLAWLKREGFAESRQSAHNGRMLEWRIA